MTRDAISDLIAGGEGATVEFKRSLARDVGRELCAFANAGGGMVLLGVTDAGKVVGVADHNRSKARVLSTARSADPPIEVEVESAGEVLRVAVPPQKRKPYSFGGRFFMRDGASSRQLSSAEIEDLFYAAGRLHFDKKPCPDFSIENDLDDETWGRFSRRAKIPETMDRMAALRNLGLLDGEDRMTHAGAWLTARDVRRFTTSAHVSSALFMGTEKVRILDRRDFCGDVATMVDDTVTWMLSKINVEFIIKHVRREERPELPEEALREAVANAVAHRDYRSTANVQIYVFKDRVEIVSPGGLPVGMTVADLGTKSLPRNPLLFGMLYRMDVVEQIGSGIRRIRHSVPRTRCAGADHRRVRALGDGDVSETGGAAQRGSRPSRDSQHRMAAKRLQDGRKEAQDTRSMRPMRADQEDQAVVMPRPKMAPEGAPSSSMEEGFTSGKSPCSKACAERPATGRGLLMASGYSTRTGNFKRAIERHLAMNLLELTIPDKPRSGKQRYRLTTAGRQILAGLAGVK